MGVFQQFPYSNFHEMNLDEIIKIVKQLADEWVEYQLAWDNLYTDTEKALQDFKDYVYAYFDNLDVQVEINNKIDAMVLDGTFNDIVIPDLTPVIISWLNDHITNPSNPPLDTSLRIGGAAADAEATGDAINKLKAALDFSYNPNEYIKSQIEFQTGTLDGNTGQEVVNDTTIRTAPMIFDVPTTFYCGSSYSAKLFYYSDSACTTRVTDTEFTGSVEIRPNRYCRVRIAGTATITNPTDNPIYDSVTIKNDHNYASKIYVESANDGILDDVVDKTNELFDYFVDKTTHANTYVSTSKKCNDPSAWESNVNFTASSVNEILPNKSYIVASTEYYNNGETQMFCDVNFYDDLYTFISKQQNTRHFTSPANAKYFILVFYNTHYSAAPTGLDDLSNVIVEEGTYTDYLSFVYPLTEPRIDKIRPYTGYEEKKWMVIGDSMTEHNFRAFANYHDYIRNELGFEIINCGVSGSGYKMLDNENKAFYQRISEYSSYEPDVITVFGGINDILYSSASIMGDITDTGTTTWLGCVYNLINNLRTTFPNVPFGIMSPIPDESHNPNDKTNTEYVFVQKLEELCDYYCIPFLNQYNKSGFTPWITAFKQKYTSCRQDQSGDGIHPNMHGHELIYPRIREFLRTII